MKILLFGCNGQIGWELQRSLSVLGDLIALHRTSTTACGDLAQPNALRLTLETIRPDVIVNAAAYTAVDRAEREQELARVVNADAPELLARAAAEQGAWLVHFSTDYVFDGHGNRPFEEDDGTGPLNAYGQTKLDGEQRIRASGCRHLILRTSWVYSARGDNFGRTMLKLAAEREQLSVVADQVGAPTGADLVADVTAHALRSVVATPGLAGTYHVVSAGETTWHAYAQIVIEWARAQGLAVRVTRDQIVPVPSSAFPTTARRPLNSRLNTQRLQRAFGLTMPHWQPGVLRTLAEMRGQLSSP